MKFPGHICGLLMLAGLYAPAQAEEYKLSAWVEDMQATRWEAGAVLLGVTGLGFSSWDWGSSKTFRWKPEGWFAADTYLGGSDKLGHAYTSYAVTNVLYDHLAMQGRPPQRAMLSAVLTTQAIMTYMEVLDGYSGKYGFSPEDLLSNLLGSGFAYVRATRPGMRELVDFRLEYEVPGYKGLQFRSNYLLTLKLSGVDALRDTPLRFVELQAGYNTRGYIRAEQDDGYARSRHVFVGVGLNVSELLLGRRASREALSRNNGRLFFEHVQVPYTATRSAREL
ncbi:MAG: DUF2279 domain-containing protein [Nitrosomonadales bacterium]|nr:DUF2279 domain-containing protein [Nitrosomonadales bacterium]